MTEEELEEQIQSYNVGIASLSRYELGRSAQNESILAKLCCEHERKIGGTIQFQLPQSWRGTKGRGVKIALLDTGINLHHPDLVDSIIGTADFTGQGVEDLHGHGTHSAGIIGAKTTSQGLTGLAPESGLLIGKVINNEGVGNFGVIAEGVDWAVDSGADIIAMSMCGPNSSPLLYRSITYALAKGVHIICAHESNAGIGSGVSYPGKYGGTIAVASHIRRPHPAFFDKPDFRAPGHSMWSTYKNGSYQEMAGASVSTAFVTGIAALMVSRYLSEPYTSAPIFNCEDLRTHLSLSAAAEKGLEHEDETSRLARFLVMSS